jgi:uncharacterized protein
MKVLVTGATGLVGKKLLDYLLNQGYTVHILTHSKNKISTFKDINVKSFYWNVEDEILDFDSLDGVEAIIHLAGATISKRWTKSYKDQIVTSRVNGIELLYDSIKKIPNHQIKHFVTASAIGVYPNSLTEKYDETYSGNSNFFLAQVVSEWETAANLFSTLNIKVSKLRTGLVLDANSGAFPLMALPVKYFLGTNFGSGKQIYSWIHVDDLVRMYAHVLKNQIEGVFNAVASTPVSSAIFMETIAKNLKTKIWLPNVPSWILKLAMGEMAHLLIDGQYVSNKKIKETDFVLVYDDLDLAIKSCLT